MWLLLPPPQPGAITINANSSKSNSGERRRGTPISRAEKSIKPPAASQCPKCRCPGDCSIAVAAVVVTMIPEVTVVSVPLAVIVGVLNTHAASEGSPEQERVMALLNPVDQVTATELDPDAPGAETTTCDWIEGTAAKNPGWMVTVIGGVLLLVLKLRSPA